MNCAVMSVPGVLDASACRSFWFRRLHPAGPTCPYCRVTLVGQQAETFRAGGRVRCNDCNGWSTYRTNTLLHNSKINDCHLFLLAFLTATSCQVPDIAIATSLTTDTVRAWQRRFREASNI
jgi:transposase-like protein